MSDYDSPYKELIDRYLRLVLSLLFPEVYADIDWSKEVESLDAELQKLYPEGKVGKRLADKLVKVRTLSGDDRYLHFEAQGDREDDFERRMFIYQYRGDDRFGLPMEALVILADESPSWRPTKYLVKLKRTSLTFQFKPVKLLSWKRRIQWLMAHENPVGLFLVAHLKAKETREDLKARAKVKLNLIENLRARKLEPEDLRQFYRMFDWLLELPAELDKEVWEEIRKNEQEKENLMPFVTFAERYGMEKGMEKGQRDGVLLGLEIALRLKFGTQGTALMPALREVEDSARLTTILQTIEQAASLDDVRKLLPTTNGATH